MGVIICAVVSYLFYESIIAFILMCPGIIYFIRKKKQSRANELRKRLNVQFKDGIQAISASLQAGYSIENSFIGALQDIQKLYDDGQPVIQEFRHIILQMQLNVTIEELLMDLAERSQVEDIRSFAQVFIAAKRSGGDFPRIIKNTVHNISGKLETREEIITAMSGKKMEQRIMSLVPFGVILYVKWTNPEFIRILYGNVVGWIIMTCCLIGYLLAYSLAEKIIDIEV